MEKVKGSEQDISTKDEEIGKGKQVATPLPKAVTAITFTLMLFNGMKLTMVFSYLPKLVQWFGVPNVDVGYYAGFIAASVFLGRFLFSFVWGNIADMYGKKRTAIVSACTLAITSLLFGFSDSFWYALVARFLQGCSTGLIPICKAILRENCDDTNMTLAMSIILSAFSTGLLFGPSFAGFLAFPADVFPSAISQDSFLGRHPALLPNLFIMLGLFITIIFASIYLPKDRQVKKYKGESSTSIEQKEKPERNKKKVKKGKLTQILKQKWCVICSLLYMLNSFVGTGMNETFPIYAATLAKYGGLSFKPYHIGLALLSTAAFLIVFQIFALTKLSNMYGSKAVLIWCCVIFGICAPFLPCIAIIQNTVAKWIVLIVYLIVCRVCISGRLLGLNLLVINSVEDPSFIASANGFAIGLASIGRAAAPGVFGSIFAWSLTNEKGFKGNNRALGFPFNQYFVFLLLSIFSLFIAFMTWFLPDSLNRSSKAFIERQEINNAEKKLTTK